MHLLGQSKHQITLLFIILSCLIAVITWFGQLSTTLWFHYDIELIRSGQVWRLITPIFLHFSVFKILFAHLAFNMIWFYQFGTIIERSDSSKILLSLILVAAIISNITQAVFSTALFGGMSGVVYALLGYLLAMNKANPSYRGKIANNIAYVLIIFMVVAALGLLGHGIANAAHLSGFIVGIIFAMIKVIIDRFVVDNAG